MTVELAAATAVAALLEGLDGEQREAVTSTAAPLCILAGAGSGKTRVLTRRIAHRCATGDADARHVLALTFTRKAAGELLSRLRLLGLRDRVCAGTFHAVAYAQLRQRWSEQRRVAPSLLDRKGRIIGPLLRRGLHLADVAGEIEWAKARLVAPGAYAEAAARAGRTSGIDPEAMAALYTRYEAEKKRRGLVDFDDLLWLCTLEIERDEGFAGAQRWRFRHLFVDEFQDVNPLQLRLLDAWRGGRADLCVVGDPHQAIYGWNGADVTALTRFSEHYPGSSTVNLQRNYRSSPQVLAIANGILDAGGVRGLRLRATHPDGALPALHRHVSDEVEARSVARLVRDAHGPSTPWSHQAVLVRTNAQAVMFAEAFRAAAIPVRLRGQAPFLDLPDVKEALRALQRDRRGFFAAIAEIEASARPDADSERCSGEDLSIADVGTAAADTNTAEMSDAARERARNIEEIVRLAGEYATDEPEPSAAGFSAWLLATLSGEQAPAGEVADAVDIATFHAAKGLEWPIVHVCGIEEGLLPIGHARTTEEIEEERRLFYVAVTRAERMLHLSWAERRNFGSRAVRRRPSPYLDELEAVLEAMARRAAPADSTAQLPRARSALRSTRGSRSTLPARSRRIDPADQPLIEALREWRSRRSRASNVPAYVVFDDRTLHAIAAARPTDDTSLLAVHGIGPTKLELFGAEILRIVAEHR